MAKLEVAREADGRLLRLALSAPPGNVLDSVMMTELDAALAGAETDARLCAVVIEGAGKHFCFGAAVEEHTRERVGEMLARFHGLFRRLARLALPTIAAVRGQCLGGGLELAAWCTWIVAAPDAVFGQPEIRLGVFAPMGSLLLDWRLGGGSALDLCVSGRGLSVTEAAAAGLVHEVADDPGRCARELAAKHLFDKSPSSLRFAERAARAGLTELLEQRLPQLERLYLDELMATADANEGIAAFMAKRAPRWQDGAIRQGGHA
jgi:cyclohexa-1,5-dienecarbonyl-CoA hydratase